MKELTELFNEVLTHISDVNKKKVYLDRFNSIMATNAHIGYDITDKLAVDNYKFARNLIALKFAEYNGFNPDFESYRHYTIDEMIKDVELRKM